MGLFSNFPYSDFENINLDWIINKVLNLQDNFNKFTNQIDNKITEQDRYLINSINRQNEEIAQALQYIRDNIQPIVNETINKLIDSGEMYIGMNYVPETEELNIILSREE